MLTYRIYGFSFDCFSYTSSLFAEQYSILEFYVDVNNIYVGMKKGIQHCGKLVWHQTLYGLRPIHHWSFWVLSM
jgi:hypothetical protein